MRPSLGDFEQIVLLATLRLGENAYAVPIREEIAVRTGRRPSIGALHTTLNRLEEKGLVVSKFGDPTPQRGGRSKRYFKVNARGKAAVARVQLGYRRLMEGLSLPGLDRA